MSFSRTLKALGRGVVVTALVASTGLGLGGTAQASGPAAAECPTSESATNGRITSVVITRAGETAPTGTPGFSGLVRPGDVVTVVFDANCSGVFSLATYNADLSLLPAFNAEPKDLAFQRTQTLFDSASRRFTGGTTGNRLTVSVPFTSTSSDPAGCTNKFATEVDRFNQQFNGNGSAVNNPYRSTCDGRASQNGNGHGNADGRPCQGCVGNADNKNPKGQAPDGSDRNNGYECDGNNGVGKGNPAHTSCLPSAFQIDFHQSPVLRTIPDSGLPNQIQAQVGF